MISEIAVFALLACDPALTRLFTPVISQLGHYEVCTDRRSIEAVRDAGPEGPRYGAMDEVEALDAFGTAGTYDPSAIRRLYGGRRVRVVRGWMQSGNRFESRTLISPYPDASLTRLEPGTMVIRWIYEN